MHNYAWTGAQGRAPLLVGDAYRAGVYELGFHFGDHIRAQDVDLPQPTFVDRA